MLPGVIWFIVFAGIAVAGLVMVISYVVWLVHKASDVMSEVAVLLERSGQLAELLSQIRVPDLAVPRDLAHDSRVVE
jgi:hypothetical protein